MTLEDRKRKIIHKPTFNGVPISWARTYLIGRLKSFRKENPEFDTFLNEISELIKDEKSDDYSNLIKFINNEGEGNWISPSESMLTVFVKLYNLCLSPTQAAKYIKECHDTYLKMLKRTYKLGEEYEIFIKRSRWNSDPCSFINVHLTPYKDSKTIDYSYWCDITFSTLILNDNEPLFEPDLKIVVKGDYGKFNDALQLFEYYQDKKNQKTVLKSILSSALTELKQKGIIKHLNVEDCIGTIGDRYEIKGSVGLHKIK